MLVPWDVFPMHIDCRTWGWCLDYTFRDCRHDSISCILVVVVGEIHGFHMTWLGYGGAFWVSIGVGIFRCLV